MTSPAKRFWPLYVASLIAICLLGACTAAGTSSAGAHARARYLESLVDEPATTDFQCTTIDYTIGLNVFDRLVETQKALDGGVEITPSLAESWEMSSDGLVYTFHLRPDVSFSNGSPLTSSDVLYTFTRLLTHPNSQNGDLVSEIVGSGDLAAGSASALEGFEVIDDLSFRIRLEQPFSAFLACLCMPGASILDEETTEAAGESFGMDPAQTVGTGPFVFESWDPGEGIMLAANPAHWAGRPALDGVHLRFEDDPNVLIDLYDEGELDIVNADDFGEDSDFFLHGETHKSQVRSIPHVGIDYIALNEAVKPLDDVRVRRALQLALDRQTLLDAAYGGSGVVENGIFPVGLKGHNPDLPALPYDPAEAKKLLADAGYADGFDLSFSMRPSSTRWQRSLADMVVSMWAEVGVRAEVSILSEDEFMSKRKNGELACYTASWAADFDDPDNFIYTFFGTYENSFGRSLCYANEDAMARVRAARGIVDDEKRIKEYHDLERLIIQQDAAWVPLFSRERHFLVSDRVETFVTSWNGWFETSYRYMSLKDS